MFTQLQTPNQKKKNRHFHRSSNWNLHWTQRRFQCFDIAAELMDSRNRKTYYDRLLKSPYANTTNIKTKITIRWPTIIQCRKEQYKLYANGKLSLRSVDVIFHPPDFRGEFPITTRHTPVSQIKFTSLDSMTLSNCYTRIQEQTAHESVIETQNTFKYQLFDNVSNDSVNDSTIRVHFQCDYILGFLSSHVQCF